MSCKYCDIKMRPLDEDTKVLKGEDWKDEFGEGGYIGQSYNDKFHMMVYYDAGYACTDVPDVKYCPFCGEELKMPPEPLIKDKKIRKAVRAWAEACGVGDSEKLRVCQGHGCSFICVVASDAQFSLIGVDYGIPYDDYCTITELCGEKEE